MRRRLLLAALAALATTARAATVAVDVGHFLDKPGATSAYGVPEFEYNHSLAAVIAARLAADGVAVRLIGRRGEMADLHARPREAEEGGADFLLSVHHDSVKAHLLDPWTWRGRELLHSEAASGFSLFVSRRMNRVADYARAFDIARDAGLGLTIHAGELVGPQSVIDALDLVRPSRIGHGVRAIEDPDLVKRLADLGTVLEVCPGSNIALKVYPDYDSHPLKRFLEAGVRVTLNSDDPPFFHTTLAMEYERAQTVFGLSHEVINAMTRTAIEAAFVDEATRTALLARL